MHNTLTALAQDEPLDCGFCRCAEKGPTYQCQQPATTVWAHEDYVPMAVCAECAEWIETLRSLGQL